MKKGTIVQIKTWEEMEKEFGLNEIDAISCMATFVDEMKPMCGKKIKLEKDIEGHCVIGTYLQETETDFLIPSDYREYDLAWEISTDMVKEVKQFSKGDKVELIMTTIVDEIGGFNVGDTGIVINVSGEEVYVKFNDKHSNYLMFASQLKKVDDIPQDLLDDLCEALGLESVKVNDEGLIECALDEDEEDYIAELELTIKEITEENEDLVKENEELYTEIDDLRSELLGKQEEIEYLNEVIEQLKEDLENERYDNAFMQRLISNKINN